MARPCGVCKSPHRDRINELLTAGATARTVNAELTEKGEKGFTSSSLSRHKQHIQHQNERIDFLVHELNQQADMAPATIAPLYHIIVRNLEGLHHTKPSADQLTKAIEALTRVSGLNHKQAMLMAFAERAFQPGGAMAPTEVQQLPAALMDDERKL